MESQKPFNKSFLIASSLIESVIAITIIALCMVVALKLYITILESRPSKNNHKLKYQVDKLLVEMKLNPNFNYEVYEYDSYRITKTVSENQNVSLLKKVSYSIEQQKDTVTYHYYLLADEQ